MTPYSSLSRRLLAMALDGLILLIPSSLFHQALPYAGSLVLWFLYAPILESSRIQATIGKKVVGIQVQASGPQGGRIGFRPALVRSLLKLLSGCMLFAGHFFALFTARKQALHDLVADTVVVDGVSDAPVIDAWVESFRSAFKLEQGKS